MSALDWTLVVLEVLLAIGAVAGGIALVTGSVDLGEATQDLPFGSAALGGIALLVINGVLPLVVAIGALRRAPWAIRGHLLVGLALMGWIVVQVAFIGLGDWLQPAYFVWGAAILGLGLLRLRPTGGSVEHASVPGELSAR